MTVADVRDAPGMSQLLAGVDVVYHLACLGVRHSIIAPEEDHEVNAGGTLLEDEIERNWESPA